MRILDDKSDKKLETVTIFLTRSEYIYLCQASFLEDKYRKLLFSSEQQDGRYSLNISEDQLDEIRDVYGERLQMVGFNEKYELSQEGKILETLIDKFFVGRVNGENKEN